MRAGERSIVNATPWVSFSYLSSSLIVAPRGKSRRTAFPYLIRRQHRVQTREGFGIYLVKTMLTRRGNEVPDLAKTDVREIF
jgi:hypothetical protein